ncbi:MAG: helix-turn-helix domain-containing protein [bacterium]
MKQNQLLNFLKDIGMTDNEAIVYLTLLSLGPSTILKLSKASEIKRTTVYAIVDSLTQKGLIKIEVKGFKKLFIAEKPEKLKIILELQRKKMEKLLPEFQAIENLKGGESFLKYYEGLEAIKGVYEEILKEMNPKEEYLSVGNPILWFSIDNDYFQNFRERRAKLSRKLNFRIRHLLKESPRALELKKCEANYNEKIKILPEGINFSSNLIILQKKIIIHQLISPMLAIVIENRSVVQLQRELFNIIWEACNLCR